MSAPELTAEEQEWVKRPPTDEEKAGMKGMPPFIAEGWIRRKRAQEIAEQRSARTTEKLETAITNLGEWLNEHGGKR